MARLKIHGYEVEAVQTGAGVVPIPPDTTADGLTLPAYLNLTTGKVTANIATAGIFFQAQVAGVNRLTISGSGGTDTVGSTGSNTVLQGARLMLNYSGGEGFRLDTSGRASIGTAADALASAQLEIGSTTRGLLIPRMTTTQRDAIASPAEGLEIYNLTTHKKNIYTGSAWEAVTSA